MKILCPKTGKQVYGTPGRAELFAVRLTNTEHKAYRVYRCEFCGWFHITHKPYSRHPAAR
jgi:hypothetical protein